jgi:hypothetical protein
MFSQMGLRVDAGGYIKAEKYEHIASAKGARYMLEE